MHHDQLHYVDPLNAPDPTWQPISVASAIPYLKAIGLLMTLIMAWAGLCTI